jgi:hypothetical protein
MKVEFIRSEEQLDDSLIKPLDKVKFLKLHIKIGLIDLGGHNKAFEENVRKEIFIVSQSNSVIIFISRK